MMMRKNNFVVQFFIITFLIYSFTCQLWPVIDYGSPTRTGSFSGDISLGDNENARTSMDDIDCTDIISIPSSGGFDTIEYMEVDFTVNTLGVQGLKAAVVYNSSSTLSNFRVITLFNVPGFSEDDDDGNTPVVYNSKFDDSVTITYSDQGIVDGEVSGVAGPFICNSDNICNYKPAGNNQNNPTLSGIGANYLNSFRGLIGFSISESWRLCFGNRNIITGGNPTGSITSATLKFWDVTPVDLSVSLSITTSDPVSVPGPILSTTTVTTDVAVTDVNCYIQSGARAAVSHTFSSSSGFTCDDINDDTILCSIESISPGVPVSFDVSSQFVRTPVVNGASAFNFQVEVFCTVIEAPFYETDPSNNRDTDTISVTGSQDGNVLISTGTGFELPLSLNYQGYMDFTGLRCVGLINYDDGFLEGISVEVNVELKTIGRAVFKVISPDGTIVTLLSMPGLNETFDGSAEGIGTATSMDSSSTVLFSDFYARSAEWMGWQQSVHDDICADGGICGYHSSPGAATDGGLSDLIGTRVGGTWRFCVGLNNGGGQFISSSVETGFIDDVSFRILKTDLPPGFESSEDEFNATCNVFIQQFNAEPCDETSFIGCTPYIQVADKACRSLGESLYAGISCNKAFDGNRYVKITDEESCLFGGKTIFENECVELDGLYYAISYNVTNGCEIPTEESAASILSSMLLI